MNYDQMREHIEKVILEHEAKFMAHSNDLFDHPEISGEEYESSRKTVELLKSYGYEVEFPYWNIDTCFRGIYGENNHKYKICLMVEYDALPEVGHACGHCLSGAISLLAGVALKDLQDELDADIHILGTPAEETDGKKCQMSEEGLFDQYDFAMMIHLDCTSKVKANLQCLAGRVYTFHGKSAHASAAPWDGINALNASQLFFHAIDMMRQHVLPGTQFHGIYHHGGDAPNIVPEKVVVEEYMRSTDKKYLDVLREKVENCAKGACIATGATYDVYKKDADYYNQKANATGEAAIEEAYIEAGVELNGDPDVVFGSSDVGNVSWYCPAFQPTLQVCDGAALHTRAFAEAMKTERAEKALQDGAKIIATTVVKIFSDEEKIKSMKAEFAE